jgi:cytochrome P450
LISRHVLVDLDMGGRRVVGEIEVAVLGAVDCDPALSPQPDGLDLARLPDCHLAFGGGIHLRLGRR